MENYLNEVLDLYKNIQTPDLVKNIQNMNLAKYQIGPRQIADLISAAEANAPLQQDLTIRENPENRQNILNNIAQFGNMANTGFGAQDIANQFNAQNRAMQAANAQRMSLDQEMQRTGGGNARFGLGVAGKLLAGQQGANQIAETGMNNAAAGAANRTNVLANIGSQYNNLRGQDLATQEKNQQIKSLQAQQLSQNALRANMANQQYKNQAGMYNTMAAANAANANTGQYNQQQMMANYYAPQQMFSNDISKAGGVSGAYTNMANNAAQRAAAAQNTWAQIGSGLGQLGMFAMMASKGGTVPGIAKHEGDHRANDTVPAMLSPGEIVIPRSIAQNPGDAAQFAKHHATMNETLKKLNDLLRKERKA
jgi:hypothetical protein